MFHVLMPVKLIREKTWSMSTKYLQELFQIILQFGLIK